MTNEITYSTFFKTVQESISNGTFAKLTLAKTIGKPELQNIYIKLLLEENILKCTFTKKIYDGEKHEVVSIHEIENLEAELTPYFTNPFFSALLFTTEADITMKINKKKVASIIEQPPTFKNADIVLVNYLNQ
ncbi:hypothetical protein FIA58_005555 [Flavobacterium jejuense]|uniref:SseB protein N-terminal domain-containing protein n=1 Tax=Flavobacterium jejuense TaxID=1544455 RepID=A0ABX0IPI5_9FLAO|nr:hypothetical protein [Flavobacterium jejuense]NHN25141.1 hypothetical protein [Flavobacterium jejuense]